MKNKIKNGLILALAVVLVLGIASVAQAANKTITGTITDSETGQGIAGATVTWRNDIHNVSNSTTTDASGNYSLTVDDQYGTIGLIITAPGYEEKGVGLGNNTTYSGALTPIQLFTLTVTGGSGGGSYEEGEAVTITADAPADGKEFDTWTSSGSGTFADTASASTTFTMPADDVTITAGYRDVAAEPTPTATATETTTATATATTTENSPKTADSSGPGYTTLFILLACAAAGILLSVAALRRHSAAKQK